MSELTGRQLAELLCEHLTTTGSGAYSGKDWMAATEVSLPHRDGGRVDVLAARKSWSNFEVRAHEVKVSRADFFADVNAGKFRRYLTACHTVVFVVPAGMVKAAEVPDEAGLLVYDRAKDAWRMQRKPPRTPHPECLDERVVMALAMAVDSTRASQIGQLTYRDIERECIRDRFLGKRAARRRFRPEDLDTEALLDFAITKAGYHLRQQLAVARERGAAYDELVTALQDAGVKVDHRGGYQSDVGARLMASAAAHVRHATAMTAHLDALAQLASHLGNRLAGMSHERRDPEQLVANVDNTVPGQLRLVEDTA